MIYVIISKICITLIMKYNPKLHLDNLILSDSIHHTIVNQVKPYTKTNKMKKTTLLLILICSFSLFASLAVKADCTISTTANSSTNPLSGCSGIITISGMLNLDSDYDLTSSGITQIIITSTGSINWAGNFDLTLPAGLTMIINPGGLIMSNLGSPPCNSIRRIIIGTQVFATCNGNGIHYTFVQVVLNGGIFGNLTLSAGSDSPVCPGGDLHLTATPTGGVGPYSYEWNGPSGFSSTSQNPIVSPAVAGTYSVTVTDDGGITASSSTLVGTSSIVTPVISGAGSFCPSNAATLDAGAGYTSYVWSTGAQTQTINIINAGNYSVTVSNADGCTAFNSVGVTACVSNIPLTQLRSIDCGKLNLTQCTEIVCVPVANATSYQFEFRDTLNASVYSTKIQNSYALVTSTMNPLLQWQGKYNVRVRARVNGVWGNYGTTCRIGLIQNPAITGVPSISLRPQFCNVTNLALSSTISSASPVMVNTYEFKFTDLATSQVITKLQPTSYLLLSSVNPALLAGHTYAVAVRGFVCNTWSSAGTVCNITIAEAPNGAREITASEDENGEMQITERIISDMSLFELAAYPNPFDEDATFMINTPLVETIQLIMYNINGQIVFSKQVVSNQNTKLEGDNLDAGIYFLKAYRIDGSSQAIKLIKSLPR